MQMLMLESRGGGCTKVKLSAAKKKGKETRAVSRSTPSEAVRGAAEVESKERRWKEIKGGYIHIIHFFVLFAPVIEYLIDYVNLASVSYQWLCTWCECVHAKK